MKDKAIELRHDYRSCLKIADETDSKKEDRFLRDRAIKVLSELKKICPHDEIVVLQSAYEDSYSRDHDDDHPEHRICLCCGTEEYTYEFKVLTNRPIARFEGKYPDQVKQPLKSLLTEVQELVKTKGYIYFDDERKR